MLESANLHVLVATPTKVKQWAHLTKEANILFEVYGKFAVPHTACVDRL